jgi:soluble cytochrome b562
MKTRTLFTSFVLALTLGSVAFAQGGPGGPGGGGPGMGGPGGPGGPQAPKTDLEVQMGKINDAQGTPRNAFGAGNVADLADAAKKDEALKRIAIIKEAATAAIKLAPKYTPAAITSDADKAKYVAEFQDTMKKFVAAVDALEVAVKAGKTAEAPGLWDAANKIHNDGHSTYRAPRGGRGGAPGAGGPGGPGMGGGQGGPGGGAPRGGN